MEHEEDTAGALMTTEFIALPPELTVAQAFRNCANRRRKLRPSIISISWVRMKTCWGSSPAGTPHLRAGGQAGQSHADPDHLGAPR